MKRLAQILLESALRMPHISHLHTPWFTQGHSVTVRMRKDPSADYEEPTQSALKKAKKSADGLEKKRKKAEELAEREARARGEDREKRERLLDESRKVQLVEDATLPTAIGYAPWHLYEGISLSTIHRQRF
jgi:asparaginyl-tRNA synthetase